MRFFTLKADAMRILLRDFPQENAAIQRATALVNLSTVKTLSIKLLRYFAQAKFVV